MLHTPSIILSVIILRKNSTKVKTIFVSKTINSEVPNSKASINQLIFYLLTYLWFFLRLDFFLPLRSSNGSNSMEMLVS